MLKPARQIGGHRSKRRVLLLSAWPEHYFISSVITPHVPCGTRGEDHSSVGKNYNASRNDDIALGVLLSVLRDALW